MTSLSSSGAVDPVAPLVMINQVSGEIVAPSKDRRELRRWLAEVTNRLLLLPQSEQRQFEVKHTFLNGMYMRELFIPKGSLLVGKIHRLDCLNVVSKGDISVLTETGSMRIRAGYTAPSPAGIQKLGFAHEDTVFINVFRTDETSLEKIELAIAFESFDAADAVRITDEREILCL